MKWNKTNWFNNLCFSVVCMFFSTSVSPMAFGFAPPQPRQGNFVPYPAQLVSDLQRVTPPTSISSVPSQNILKNSTSPQISKVLEVAQEKLKDLDVLLELQNRQKGQQEGSSSCAVPEGGPLELQKDTPFSLSSSSNGSPGIEYKGVESLTSVENITALPTVGKGKPKRRVVGEKKETWLGKLGNVLGSLFVGEAHAQEPPAGPLDSTPDANTADQFIIDKAADLTVGATTPQEKAEAIFNFVRDEIGYESYRGSLRGARGTLWSMAGNALDQASLLIALLRVSGIPAQYAKGTITDPLAQDLILSMFPNPTRVVGCPPPEAERADPANDPQLLAETREHFWVELDMGGGFSPADPTFNSKKTLAQLDQSFATTDATFTEVPDSLRHKVTVRLKAELSDGFTGGLKDPKTVLNHTFNTVELIGHPLSIGHFVNSVPAGES